MKKKNKVYLLLLESFFKINGLIFRQKNNFIDMNRIKYIITSIVLISSSVILAQTPTKYAGEFISIGGGSRPLGMGGAFVAIADESIASYWNPAGLIQLDHPEIHLMYAERFGGIVKFNFMSAAMSLKNESAIAVSIMRIGVDDIPISALPNPDLPVGVLNKPFIDHKVNDVEYIAYFSYAKRWKGNSSIGTNVKFIRKSIGENTAWGIGFDIGMLTSIKGNLQFGVNLQDITTTLIAWDTGTKELIVPNVKWGFSYPIIFNSLEFLPAFDIDTRFEGRKFASQLNAGGISFDFHFGLEGAYKKLVYLRTGSDIGQLVAGAGIQLPKLRFDAAFMNHQALGDTYRLSVTFRFEKDKSQ